MILSYQNQKIGLLLQKSDEKKNHFELGSLRQRQFSKIVLSEKPQTTL